MAAEYLVATGATNDTPITQQLLVMRIIPMGTIAGTITLHDVGRNVDIGPITLPAGGLDFGYHGMILPGGLTINRSNTADNLLILWRRP